MSIQTYLNEFDKRLFKTKSYDNVMSDDILAYRLLKSVDLSSYHEELVKAAIPDLQYDIIKDQLKKTLSDASRQIPTKSDEIIETEGAFMVDEINHLSFRESYHQNELPLVNEYNPFRDTPNQLSTDQNHDTYYIRGNYRNYQQKPNPMNRPYQHNTSPRTSPTFNRQQHNRREKNPCNQNGIQLRSNICESIYHMAQNCPQKRDLYYTKQVILFQSHFNHPEQVKILA